VSQTYWKEAPHHSNNDRSLVSHGENFLESIPLTAAVWKLRVPRVQKNARWEIHALVIAD
jgi:hypothetical protein